MYEFYFFDFLELSAKDGDNLQHLPVFQMPMSIKSGTVSYQDTCVSHGFLKYTFEQNTNMLFTEGRLSGGLIELF